MGKSDQNDDASNYKKYGVPLYGAAWVPPAASSIIKSGSKSSPAELESAASSASNQHIVLAGGGGEGRSGIPNALLVSAFDFTSNSLSDQPVGKLGTGSDLPYRIAVHPGGEGLICSLPKSCRWFDWDSTTSKDEHSLNLKSSEKVLEKLEDVGQQLALAFNNEGTLLAVEGEDGKLRVCKWLDMEITLDEANAHASVKDLDFSRRTLSSLPNPRSAPVGFYQSVLHVSDIQSAESDILLIQNCWSLDVSEGSVYKMEPEKTLQALKDIVPAALNNINAKFILLDKDKVTLEGQHKTCLALVADETAAVHFQLWGDECDAFEPGDSILLANGIFSYNRNNLVLRAGKRGKVEKVGEFTMTFVETPNMSEIRWVPDSINSKKYVQEAVISTHSHIFPPMH